MEVDEEDNIKKTLLQSSLLILFGIIPPLLALTTDWRPEGENMASWFQRSGSILVIFSVLVEFKLLTLFSTFYPGAEAMLWTDTIAKKYYKKYLFVTYLSAILAIIGTIIWGYGDVLIKNT